MKLYIDSATIKPEGQNWLQIKDFDTLQNIFSTLRTDEISYIYIGKRLHNEEGQFPEFNMMDVAVELIERFKGKPFPEITVKQPSNYAEENPAAVLRNYSKTYNHRDLCTEVK